MERKMFVGMIAILLIMASVSVAFAGGEPETDEVVLRVGHVGAPVSPQQAAGEIFQNHVEEMTGGTVVIELHDSATLGDEAELVEGMVTQTIDGGIVSSGLYGGYYEPAGAFEIPFLFEDREHSVRVNTGSIGEHILAELSEQAGLQAVAIWEHGFRHITNNVRAIREPEDLRGLSIRSPEVVAYEAPLRALGVDPVPMAFGELYVALDRGVVDGQHNPLLHVYGQSFYEVQDHLTMMDFAYTPNIVAFSNSAWNRLSEEQQELVREAAIQTAADWAEEAEAEENRLLEELRDRMNVVERDEIDRAAFAEIVVEQTFPDFRERYGTMIDDILEAAN